MTALSPLRPRSRPLAVALAALVAVGGSLVVASPVGDARLETPVVIAEAAPVTPPAPPVVAVADVRVADDAVETGEAMGGGRASYYGNELAGNRTASGERFDPKDFTAAHRTLPFGTRVRVTLARTGKSVVVRVNDRGPFHAERVIDVSRAAADEIGLTRRGTAEVTLERLPGRHGVRG